MRIHTALDLSFFPLSVLFRKGSQKGYKLPVMPGHTCRFLFPQEGNKKKKEKNKIGKQGNLKRTRLFLHKGRFPENEN